MENEKRLIYVGGYKDAFKVDPKSEIYLINGKVFVAVDVVERALENAPTVDAVEVVHGRWIQSEPGYRLCSHCMADVAIYSGHRNYCPNCGAKMDGDGNG